MPDINIPKPDTPFVATKPNIPDCWSPQPTITESAGGDTGG